VKQNQTDNQIQEEHLVNFVVNSLNEELRINLGVPSVQVRTIDVDRKLDGPAVAVEFPSQAMVDHTAPTAAEFVLNRLTPVDDRYDVGVIVGVQQS